MFIARQSTGQVMEIGEIKIQVVEVGRGNVRIGVMAPDHVKINYCKSHQMQPYDSRHSPKTIPHQRSDRGFGPRTEPARRAG